MLVHGNEYEAHFCARLLDFFGSETRWQRRLWGVGLSLGLSEVLEASKARLEGTLSQEALRYLQKEAMCLAGPDIAVGTKETRSSLQRVLAEDVVFEGFAYRTLAQMAPQIDHGYLDRWADVVLHDEQRPKPERAARAVAAHLLDHGFSGHYLHRWWSYRIRHRAQQGTLSDWLHEAQGDLLARSPATKTYKVLVTFKAVSMPTLAVPPEWLSATDAAAWLRENGVSTSGLRQHGGLLFSIAAGDPWIAVQQAAERIDVILARFAIGTRGSNLLPHNTAWVSGHDRGYKLWEPRRVEVRALEREAKLFSTDPPNDVDAALHLLAPMDEGPAGSAIAGAWAAVETVLFMPGDRERVRAADRTAALVACSWPRAELTALAHRWASEHHDELAREIESSIDNRQRAKLMARALISGQELDFEHPSDRAALVRMVDVLREPRQRLSDVQSHVVRSLRRLYRQRNLVLHSGRTAAVATAASLRTAAPLLGAAFDRIAHARFVDNVDPRELAVRAQLRLDRLAGPAQDDIVDLLEPSDLP